MARPLRIEYEGAGLPATHPE